MLPRPSGAFLFTFTPMAAALETGDFFTTWANRYDSDMPRTATEGLSEEDVFPMGGGEVVSTISRPRQ